MIFRPYHYFDTGCAAYAFGCATVGKGVVVDPQERDVDGYVASTLPSAIGEQLCQHHCPVAHVAERFPQICEVETAAFSRLLGVHVQRLATIAHGDGICTTHVPNVRRTTTDMTTSERP